MLYEQAKMLYADLRDIPGPNAKSDLRLVGGKFEKRSVCLYITQYIRHVLYIRKVKTGSLEWINSTYMISTG